MGCGRGRLDGAGEFRMDVRVESSLALHAFVAIVGRAVLDIGEIFARSAKR
jgi:hypothetical protein